MHGGLSPPARRTRTGSTGATCTCSCPASVSLAQLAWLDGRFAWACWRVPPAGVAFTRPSGRQSSGSFSCAEQPRLGPLDFSWAGLVANWTRQSYLGPVACL